jgi:tetratricopeptide (TPR) repeat protein
MFRAPLLVLAALSLLSSCQRGPSPPALQSFGPLDPAVSALVAEQLTALGEAPADADRWGVLAMALEANGLTGQARDGYATATTLPNAHGRWWYHLARLRLREGDADAALAAFDAAIALSPDYVPARWRRGLLLLDRGDLDGAEAAFRVAVNLAPHDSAAATGLARVLIAKGQHREAAATLEALLERAPTDRYAYQVLATAYRALGREADAADAVAAGASGEAQWDDAWANDVGAYRRGFAAMLKDATALSLAGRYPESIALLERLRVDRPDDRELRTYLGGIYATSGRTADARHLLEDVLRTTPDDFDATMHLATAHLLSGAFDEADRLAERAQTLRQGDADAARLRGVAAWRRARFDDAERWLAEAAAADPRDAKAFGWLGMVRQERGRPAPALAAFRQALARDPLLADALVGGAAAAITVGALDDAARWLARARRVAPAHPQLAALERRLAAKGRT